MDAHKWEYIAHAGQQQYVASFVRRILHFFDQLICADGRKKLFQQIRAAICFFHIRYCLCDVEIVAHGEEYLIKISFHQTAGQRRIRLKLLHKMLHRHFFGGVITENADVDFIAQTSAFQKVRILNQSAQRIQFFMERIADRIRAAPQFHAVPQFRAAP